jgi:intracellular multiplication protein IcmP
MADNKSGASEAAMGWGILLAVLGAISYLIWWKFSEQIGSFIRWVRYGEMWVVSLFLPNDYEVSINGTNFSYQAVMAEAAKMPSDQIDGDFLALMSYVAMAPYIWVVCVLAAIFGFWALFKGPGSEHRTVYDLDGLIKRQANMFPIISPIIEFNPSKQPPRAPGAPVPAELPLFAEALGPEEWIAYNSIPVPDGKLDEEAAMKAFAKQLGARWRGVKHLEPYKQIFIAACCLKAARKRSDADTMMGRLAQCWVGKENKINLRKDPKLLKEARAVLARQDICGATLKKCNEHAWETTAIMRALATAREEGGVLAPAQFVWMRGYNRTLWYPLNNLGRQSLHPEALGAMAHYKAEKMAQRPIPRPKMTDPAKAIAEYMASNKARPIPTLDYTGSKKSGIKKPKAA